ncbi:hypothetical protein OIB37_02870 [Streptomyces sp. NBC_00820]|uniref:hypothetical protein n=1 Tax=Streptomyces sp. NBC_00820 TaxID=2975842 RepID=UPI002ED15B5A|nr:hypothetical protein OIB37_02870 [Streptomyces sp. NBC_00820]
MSKIDTTDECPAGELAGPGNLHTYRIRGLNRSALVLWSTGPEVTDDRVPTVTVDGHRRVPVFATTRQARAFANRQGRDLITESDSTLELVRVQRWLADPARRAVPSGPVLDAWNFFEDLARGLRTEHSLPRQTAVHNDAYEKLFGGECSAWTPEERATVLELLTAGVELWETCPVVVNPRTPGDHSSRHAARGSGEGPDPRDPAG